MAPEAFEIGMVNKVVSNDSLMEEAIAYATQMASAPTRSVGMIKRLLNRSFDSDLQTQLEFEAAFQGLATSTSDMVEGVTSFLEKRPPNFQGK